MVQIEVCDSEWKVNQALERLQNDGFNIQDIKFTYHNYTSKFMIIYDDNSEIKAMLEKDVKYLDDYDVVLNG
jgi:archaellum component FlaC